MSLDNETIPPAPRLGRPPKVREIPPDTEDLGDVEFEPIPGETAGRRSVRKEARVKQRYVPPQPHQKFDIPANRVPSGMVAEWKAITIAGMTNRNHMIACYRAGWTPATAEQFPENSGYGQKFGEAVVAMGLMEDIKATDPVILDGQMLMLRAKELVEDAGYRDHEEARKQVNTQLRRLQINSRREVGANTKIQRSYVQDDPED